METLQGFGRRLRVMFLHSSAVAVAFASASCSTSSGGATGGGAAGGGAAGNGCVRTYPTPPTGATSLIYVATDCPKTGADGTLGHPYTKIQEGIDHAISGAAVLVAPGLYDENVSVNRSVSVVGGSSAVDSGQAGATVKSSTPYAVSVNPGGDGALIQGLVILSPITVGILVRGAKASVRACKVTDAKPDASGQFGLGVLASEGADATIDHNSISGSAQVGVLVDGSVGSVTNNSVGGNLAGGVAVQHTSSMVEVRANVLDANVRAGVLVFGATARIADNTISNTAADPVTMIGDGVIVRSSDDASPTMSNVEVSGNTVSGNARVGVLCAIGCSGSVVKNQISHNGFQSQFAAGLWLQTGAGGTDGLQITGNTVTGNKYVGIGLTSGARGLLQQNVAINDTQAGSVVTPGGGSAMIGDGIGIFAKAAAALSGNTISGNSRFGVVLDDPTAGTTSLTSNTIAGSGNIGVVVQNTSATIDLTTNAFNGNASGDSKVVTKTDVPFVVKKDDFPAK